MKIFVLVYDPPFNIDFMGKPVPLELESGFSGRVTQRICSVFGDMATVSIYDPLEDKTYNPKQILYSENKFHVIKIESKKETYLPQLSSTTRSYLLQRPDRNFGKILKHLQEKEITFLKLLEISKDKVWVPTKEGRFLYTLDKKLTDQQLVMSYLFSPLIWDNTFKSWEAFNTRMYNTLNNLVKRKRKVHAKIYNQGAGKLLFKFAPVSPDRFKDSKTIHGFRWFPRTGELFPEHISSTVLGMGIPHKEDFRIRPMVFRDWG